eukprot:13675806-Ditylum_brightwellii.AAC.1
MRIAQLIMLQYSSPTLRQSMEPPAMQRGMQGFGSTGSMAAHARRDTSHLPQPSDTIISSNSQSIPAEEISTNNQG